MQRYGVHGWTLALQTYSIPAICKVCARQRYEVHGWTLLQTYSVLEICMVSAILKDMKFMGGRWRYKLTASLKSARSVPYKDMEFMGGRWRYKLTASLTPARSVPYKDTEFMGGRWRYKLTASLKSAKSVPYKDMEFMGGGWRYKLTASLTPARSVPYKDTKFMGGRWRYKLTASLKFARSVPYKDTEFMGGRWRYKLTASLKFAISVPYKDSKFIGGRWRYKLTASLKLARSGLARLPPQVPFTLLGCAPPAPLFPIPPAPPPHPPPPPAAALPTPLSPRGMFTLLACHSKNARPLELATQAAGRQSMPFDQMLRLAGRILRSSNSDPLRQASYKPDSAELFEGGGRRVGRPRQQWLSDADSLVYARYSNYPYDGSAHQNGLILQKAQNREFYRVSRPSADAQFTTANSCAAGRLGTAHPRESEPHSLQL